MTEPASPESNETAFERVKRIMAEPIRLPEPYTDEEIEALMWQQPITDLPNDGMQLPANEETQPDPNQLCLF